MLSREGPAVVVSFALAGADGFEFDKKGSHRESGEVALANGNREGHLPRAAALSPGFLHGYGFGRGDPARPLHRETLLPLIAVGSR